MRQISKLARNSIALKCVLLLLFISFTEIGLAQEKDSSKILIPKIEKLDTQEFKINNNLSYQYQKPKLFDFITKIPNDFGIMGNMFIQKNNLIWFGASVGTTLAIIPFDQKITDNSRTFGNQIGFQPDHSYSGPIKMFPKNINSGIYRVGNGFTALLVGGGLLTYGLINKNYRAIHTSSEIMEGLIASGLLVQPFKRITGRESPFIAEENGNSGGAWRPFPSFSAYQKNTPNYDAMPSGHLTTLMTTVMIISENYKEIKWIKPVGFVLMGLMSFEMLQSKVHWASDYPIAIFMGYIIGKSIVKGRITEKTNSNVGMIKNLKPKFHYSFSSNSNYTLAVVNMTF
ncbi:phosphatase PAP2 family protein [Flavobacterium sp. GT3R68]|uniref:phosphatase PAP2 family protein n=1 Tax=Flavobacterium sp. GT3R68 TaxID=2594437 RepID=UPI000F860608|nr:phosphatase PAP2 family protein [Flavobacterium sp. GT3R68]RTY90607.1 phosphatase PAP2 family protein [Flavobacterium sp. GSN2]TRW89867.1 phosphatase PAP2 family protein [Flavobacterium sp. GT3R68]